MATQLRKHQPEKGITDQLQTNSNSNPFAIPTKSSTHLISKILENLYPNSKASFRNYTRHASVLIETQTPGKPCWEILKRKYLNHIECYYCRDMHPIDKIHDYGAGPAHGGMFTPRCLGMNNKLRTTKFVHPNFSFTVFRMIMKKHRQEERPDELLELIAYESGVVREGAQVKHVVAVPKIVDGRLFMRTQTAYVISPNKATRMYLLCRNLIKCPHTNKWSRDNILVAVRLAERLAAPQSIPSNHPERVISSQCRVCPTEFQFNLQRFEGQGSVFFITKWQDLGDGLSPLPAEVSPVVGPRQVVLFAREGGKTTYPSPLTTSEKWSRESEFIPYLGISERKELFLRSNSLLVGLKKANDSFWWGFWASNQ